MRRLGDRARALRRSEQGVTLVEMLVAVTIGMAVLGGAVTIFMGAVKSEPRTSAKVGAIQEGRVALERITRDLRQGLEVVPTPTASQLSVLTYVKQTSCSGSPGGSEAIACRVTYTCTAGTCSRVVAEPDGSSPGAATELVGDLSTTSVFTYSPSATEPERVNVEFSFDKAQSSDAVVVADGATLRNGGSS